MRKKVILPADFSDKGVLVGALRNRGQLGAALDGRFYHIPACLVEDGAGIRFVAIYQSRNLFGKDAGIFWYGRVVAARVMPRFAIHEIPNDSDEPYCRFDVDMWLPLPRPIQACGQAFVAFMTTEFQLLHSRELTELLAESPEQYRLYGLLRELGAKRFAGSFRWKDARVRRFGGRVTVRVPGRRRLRFTLQALRADASAVADAIMRAA